MKTEIRVLENGSATGLAACALHDADIVLYFLSPDYADGAGYFNALRAAYPKARLMGCTTGGEIANEEVFNGSGVSAAMRFDHTEFQSVLADVSSPDKSYEVGCDIGEKLKRDDLRFVFILSDGLNVNGSELARGLAGHVGEDVIISGGLAGDGARFKTTAVGIDGLPASGKVAAIGLYGDALHVSYGSYGGWMKFGPTRKITKAQGNILYELDGKPALDLYKSYLGDQAEKLPGSGLLFPLSIRSHESDSHEVVRTIVGIDEGTKSLTFAGEIPQGYIAQLMHGSLHNLVEGAEQAATHAIEKFTGPANDRLAILVSCIGRNILMGQSVSSEVEAVASVFGDTPIIGFYSYGEISHHPVSGKCGLHNQTMTVSLLSE